MADSGAVLIGRRYSGSTEPDTAWMTQLCTLLLHALSLFFRSLKFSLIQVRWNREVSLRLRRLALALILFCGRLVPTLKLAGIYLALAGAETLCRRGRASVCKLCAPRVMWSALRSKLLAENFPT